MNIRYLFICLTVFFINFVYAQNKYALVVAVGDYPVNENGETIWKDLKSLNDVELLKTMFKEQKFEEQNCIYLIDSLATPKNLDKAFEKLLNRIKEGDVVYFHYSGHGQQVADMKPKKRKDIIGGDELDGYDEAFALYNAPMKFDKKGTYEMEHHYVDDQMQVQIDKIRKKLGSKGQVVLVIDACHSGTSTRGSEDPNVRGTNEICAPEGWGPVNVKDSSDAFGTDFEYNAKLPMAKIVAFFGCKADQVNNEYQPEGESERYGSLTYFLINGMKKLGENASYANLFSEIRKNMLVSFNGKQMPEIEGDDLNQAIFSNSFIPSKPFFNVKSIYYDEVNLEAGSLAGLSIGDQIGLFAIDVNNPKDFKPIFEGEITEITALGAKIKTTQGIEGDKNNIGFYRAFVLKKGSTGAEVKVKLDLKKHRKEIESRLEPMSNIRLVKSDYNFLVKELDGGKVIIYVGLDENLPLKGMNPMSIKGVEQYDSIVLFLKQASQIEMLRKLNLSSSNLDFEVKFIESNGKEVFEGLNYQIELINTGNNDLFIQTVDIEPNSTVTPLNYHNFKFGLGVGRKKIIPIEFSANPAGIDQLMFIGTEEPIDLSPLKELGNKINTRGGSNSPLVEYINSNASGTRGVSSNPGEVTVKSLIFEIKPKNNK